MNAAARRASERASGSPGRWSCARGRSCSSLTMRMLVSWWRASPAARKPTTGMMAAETMKAETMEAGTIEPETPESGALPTGPIPTAVMPSEAMLVGMMAPGTIAIGMRMTSRMAVARMAAATRRRAHADEGFQGESPVGGSESADCGG